MILLGSICVVNVLKFAIKHYCFSLSNVRSEKAAAYSCENGAENGVHNLLN